MKFLIINLTVIDTIQILYPHSRIVDIAVKDYFFQSEALLI